MGSLQTSRWLSALPLLAAGAFVVVLGVRGGNPVSTLISLALVGVIGWWSWPGRRGPHVSHADAHTDADPNDVIVYWRPG